MPVLRFARDRRGYESTYLVEARPAGSRESASLLYWFRSPPHVKIGRSAFDEDAIRLLEQEHPELDFDWDRILATKPPAAPEPKESRHARPDRRSGRRDEDRPRGPGPERRSSPAPREPSGRGASAPEPAVEPGIPVPAAEPPIAPVTMEAPTALPGVVTIAEPPPPAAARRFVRVFDRPPEVDEPPHHASTPSAAERMLGPEQLTIFRARYAEILMRIGTLGGDPARTDALREQAERVNPDAWVTEAEVAAGLAAIDATLADLHRVVGRRRRRRRRGGRSPAEGAPADSRPRTADSGPESEARSPESEVRSHDRGNSDDDEGEDDGPPES